MCVKRRERPGITAEGHETVGGRGQKDSEEERVIKYYFELFVRLCLLRLLPSTPSSPVKSATVTMSPWVP